MDWARGGNATWLVYDVTAGLKERESKTISTCIKSRYSKSKTRDLLLGLKIMLLLVFPHNICLTLKHLVNTKTVFFLTVKFAI